MDVQHVLDSTKRCVLVRIQSKNVTRQNALVTPTHTSNNMGIIFTIILILIIWEYGYAILRILLGALLLIMAAPIAIYTNLRKTK